MAGAPKTKDWTARENAHKPKGLHLIVNGLVQVSDANKAAVLTERTGRPKQLELELTIVTTSQPGIQVPVWKPAAFHKEVKANEFDSVRIMWGDMIVADVSVVDDREHGQQLAAQMKVLNVKYTGKAGPKPASKPAAKKAAPKKAAAKAKKAAKKAYKPAKKPAKKVTKKKPAKKPAKTYGFKKLVKKLVKKLTPKKSKKKGKK